MRMYGDWDWVYYYSDMIIERVNYTVVLLRTMKTYAYGNSCQIYVASFKDDISMKDYENGCTGTGGLGLS